MNELSTTQGAVALAKGGGTREFRQVAAPVAIISAGFKLPGSKAPSRSSGGEIYMHGYAPALQHMLKAEPVQGTESSYKSKVKELWVAFPFEPEQCVSQLYVKWGATRLEIIGDHQMLTVFTENGMPRKVNAGTDEYAKYVAQCTVSTFMRFALATYDNGRPDVLIGDGGFYALRTSSHNSVESILARCHEIRAFLGNGSLAGIPLKLIITSRTKVDRTGTKRSGLPIWDLQLNIPGVKPELQTRTAVAAFVGQARDAANQALALMGSQPLALPGLPAELADMALLERGGLVDPEDFLAEFWGTLNKTDLKLKENREAFLLEVLPDINPELEGIDSVADLAKVIRRVDAQKLMDLAIRRYVPAETKERTKQIETTGFDSPFDDDPAPVLAEPVLEPTIVDEEPETPAQSQPEASKPFEWKAFASSIQLLSSEGKEFQNWCLANKISWTKTAAAAQSAGVKSFDELMKFAKEQK